MKTKVKMNEDVRRSLSRMGILDSVLDRWSATAEGITVTGRDIYLDGPIVSTFEARMYQAFGIDMGFVTPDGFRQALAAAPNGDINIRINSPGGSVFDASVIQSEMLDRQKTSQVAVTIDGVAASAASFLALTGSPIRMAPMAMIMVHRSSAFVHGQADRLRHAAGVLDKIDGNMTAMLRDASNLSEAEAVKAVEAETWWTAQEAKDLGIVDEILEANGEKPEPPASARSQFAAIASALELY